ncbi:uncharacterized protein [Apostichopus japonicus]|uniref:uncharacterized protein isoform X4 n=1 Tax=Stichopus japonicus TaxID=307972 RepID=UPI003AB50C6E
MPHVCSIELKLRRNTTSRIRWSIYLSNDTTEKLRKNINDMSTLDLKQYYPGQIHTPTSTYGGSQVVAIGPDGTMVSISGTLNSPFGAKMMTDSGIILNDAMNSFDWEGKSDYKPSAANLLGPSKRPQADLAPLLSWNVSNFCTRRFGIGGVSGISNRKVGGRSAAGVAHAGSLEVTDGVQHYIGYQAQSESL